MQLQTCVNVADSNTPWDGLPDTIPFQPGSSIWHNNSVSLPTDAPLFAKCFQYLLLLYFRFPASAIILSCTTSAVSCCSNLGIKCRPCNDAPAQATSQVLLTNLRGPVSKPGKAGMGTEWTLDGSHYQEWLGSTKWPSPEGHALQIWSVAGTGWSNMKDKSIVEDVHVHNDTIAKRVLVKLVNCHQRANTPMVAIKVGCGYWRSIIATPGHPNLVQMNDKFRFKTVHQTTLFLLCFLLSKQYTFTYIMKLLYKWYLHSQRIYNESAIKVHLLRPVSSWMCLRASFVILICICCIYAKSHS